MKKINAILIISLLIIAGCGDNKQSTSDFPTVDVTANYPKKELILQNFMDVEYIPLETTDEFICQGVIYDIGRDIIIAGNAVNDGDIFIFNRKGQGLKKINRKGHGSEEYTNISRITLDEDNNEIFVNAYSEKK